MIRLILVRHGNTFESNQTPTMVGSRTDLSLTAEGCEQARQAGRAFLKENIFPKAIYSGSLKRQIETAEIVREQLSFDSPVQSREAALLEIDYGSWEGLTQEEILRRWPQEYADWNSEARWPRGVFQRSREAHLADIERWLELLRNTYQPGDSVIAMTSNGVLRFFYSLSEREKPVKVKTGHFCELSLLKNSIEILRWNVKP